MESVGVPRDDRLMDVLINVVAALTGAVTVLVGLFSLAAIIFDDLI